ncbi:MAG: DUF4166 domain-containing protein [Actinomycetota bacterium]|nr:DUF4166 domain-containing protein [Actinomycetota bacterium]
MTSIYRRALGADFERLHPMVQRRFGFSSRDGVASVGTGVMEELWRGRAYTVPFLRVGTWRNIMFPDRARDVAFTVENYAYVDRFGRETVTWIRTFQFRKRPRRFDASMIWSEERGRVVDYLGNRQHLAVDIDLEVDADGGLRLRSGEQRFYEGPIAFRFPMALSGFADVREWYADDEERYRIEVSVANPRWGPLFGYRGWFTVEERAVRPEDVPRHVRPLREERRE